MSTTERNIEILPYRGEYWKDLCAIHDGARMVELERAGLCDAFLPLEIAAEREGLLEYPYLDVAVENGAAVGFCAYTEEELAWLYVAPDRMRKGIGSALVTRALETEAGLCYAEVLVGNEAAKALYESHGFCVREILSGVMPGNEAFSVSVYAMYRGEKENFNA